jgi:uncharacterized protein (DUF2147 family)
MNVQRGRKWLAVMAVGLFSTGMFAQPVNDGIIGKWWVEGKTAQFDFYRMGNEYRARLIPLTRPEMVDTHNPVDSLKVRKLSGATLIYGLIYDENHKRWDGGKVYNPQNGKTYSCNCKLTSAGSRLLFRGFLGVSILGQTQTWTRVK